MDRDKGGGCARLLVKGDVRIVMACVSSIHRFMHIYGGLGGLNMRNIPDEPVKRSFFL